MRKLFLSLVVALFSFSASALTIDAQSFRVDGNNVAMKLNPVTGLTYYIDDSDKGAPVVVVRGVAGEISRTAMNICAGCRLAGFGAVGSGVDQTLAYTVTVPGESGFRSYIGSLDAPTASVQIQGNTQVNSVTNGRVFGISGNSAAELTVAGAVLLPGGNSGSGAFASFNRSGEVGYAGLFNNISTGAIEGFIYLDGVMTNPLAGQTFDGFAVARASGLGNFFGLNVDNDLGSIVQLYDWNTNLLYDFDFMGGILGGFIAHVSETGWMAGYDGNGFDWAVNPFLFGRQTFSVATMCSLQGNDCSWVQSVNAGTEYFDPSTGTWIASLALSGSAGGSSGSLGRGIYDSPTVVPEPTSISLMLIGLGGLGAVARRRKEKN